MKERPILFSAPMVRAILDGRKTQTRRVVKQDLQRLGDGHFYAFDHKGINYRVNARHTTVSAWENLLQFCPYGQPGDRLWVRETFSAMGDKDQHASPIFYRADRPDDSGRWTPSIHMPRWASRILLEVVGVRVEPLHDISESDALAEGIESLTGDKTIYHWDFPKPRPNHAVSGYQLASSAYKELWACINGRESLESNPWVWVIEFKRVQP